MTCAYDAANRLSTVTAWIPSQTAYTYDDANRMTTATLPNGVVSTSSYDNANRLTGIRHVKGLTTLASVSYTVDAVGNRSDRTDAAGTQTYAYDNLYRVTSVTYPGPTTTSYGYDAFGNRLTKTESGTATTYTYDAAGELTSDGTSTYTYDANGNLTARGSDSFSYDWDSRMTGATVGGTTTAYAYDGDGVRTSKTVGGGSPVNYLWDEQTGLPLPIDDGSSSYLHANGPIEDVAASGTPTYHLADALGSTRHLTDSSGSVVGTADYDIFGAPRSGSGAASALGFTGQQSDPETGFVFLRARYLDPASGRFTSADTVQPNAPGTQGFNLYAYVANDPTKWVDPSGHIAAAAGAVLWDVGVPACLSSGWCEEMLLPLLAR